MIKILSSVILSLAIAGSVFAQAPTAGLYNRYIVAQPGSGAGIESSALLGAYVKSITVDGLVTFQMADESEATVQLIIGGGLSEAEVQTLVGGMVTGNTETGITLTYQSGDQTIDAVVLVDTDQIADDAVTQAKLANNSVHAAQIGANAVGSSEIASDAVGTNELEDDAVTNAKLADDSVHNAQLASNSVRADEIQANAVGTSELVDDVTERLCPDPSGGTSGQVCARNAAGDAYELVTQSGGGGGTDDQTASEVPVTATGFSGNLSGTDTDVQTAMNTIDGFTLGGGGGSGAASVVAFKCVMTDVASASYSTDTQILECEATPSINEGTFVVEDASGTDTTDRVVIPEAGLYELIVSLYVDNGTGTRTTPHVSFTVETGGVVTILDDEGTGIRSRIARRPR